MNSTTKAASFQVKKGKITMTVFEKIEARCLFCGEPCPSAGHKPRQFCSKRCWQAYRRLGQKKDERSKQRSCVYNAGVICEKQDRCETCGWNPAVSAIRFREVRHEEICSPACSI